MKGNRRKSTGLQGHFSLNSADRNHLEHPKKIDTLIQQQEAFVAKIGYIRCSTSDQNPVRQEESLRYSGCKKVFLDKEYAETESL